jgi:hypothetical protein
MTRDSDFKKVVRARMADTGESYTVARAAIEARDAVAYGDARAEQQRLVARLFTDGRLAQVPGKRKTRAAALLEVLARFEPGRDYSEPDVNKVLLGVHEDFAYLRRELVNYRYLERADGIYRVVATAPERAPIEVQEIPAWEAAWLPGFVAGSGHVPSA